MAEEARETRGRRPSFGRQLSPGDFRLDLIHPHPRPGEDPGRRGEQFRARLREFCAGSGGGELIERDARIPDDGVKGLAAPGASGMTIAPGHAGPGLSHLYCNRALMIAGPASPALAAMLSAHQPIGVPQPLALSGAGEQNRRYLPRCARGELSAFPRTEPDAGSDPARLRMTAAPSQDGSGYLLDGVKLRAASEVAAGLLVVMARVPPGADGRKGAGSRRSSWRAPRRGLPPGGGMHLRACAAWKTR